MKVKRVWVMVMAKNKNHINNLAIVNIIAFILFAFLGIFGSPNNALAQKCGTDYTIKEGESLGEIAQKVYGNASQWTLLYYTNEDRIGENASLLVPGLSIRIPCIGKSKRANTANIGSVKAATTKPAKESFELSHLVKRIDFLTADVYQPFTSRSLYKGGMLTDLISSSMDLIKEESRGKFSYGVSWVNDRAAHLNPLLTIRAFDAGFPWSKPNCDDPASLDRDSKYRCKNFFFSAPLYEVVIAVFTMRKSGIKFESDNELVGKTLCQIAGSATYALNKNNRNWLAGNKITLMRPQSIEECFQLLAKGQVDAVISPDLKGRYALASLGMSEKVRIADRPLSLSTLHVIVSKTHPQSRTILYYVNQAIKRMKSNGSFSKIVEDHLARFWTANATTEQQNLSKLSEKTASTKGQNNSSKKINRNKKK